MYVFHLLIASLEKIEGDLGWYITVQIVQLFKLKWIAVFGTLRCAQGQLTNLKCFNFFLLITKLQFSIKYYITTHFFWYKCFYRRKNILINLLEITLKFKNIFISNEYMESIYLENFSFLWNCENILWNIFLWLLKHFLLSLLRIFLYTNSCYLNIPPECWMISLSYCRFI